MKQRYFFLFILLLLFTRNTVAQQAQPLPDFQKTRYLGIKGGLNFTTFSGNVRDVDFRTGAHASLYALYRDSRYFGIQPEVQYSVQKVGHEQNYLRMNYLLVPVMFKAYVSPFLALQAGPYVGLMLSSKYKVEGYNNRQYTGTEQDYGFAYGLSFGNEASCTLSLRHHVGLANLFPGEGTAHNQTVQASLGICLNRKQ